MMRVYEDGALVHLPYKDASFPNVSVFSKGAEHARIGRQSVKTKTVSLLIATSQKILQGTKFQLKDWPKEMVPFPA